MNEKVIGKYKILNIICENTLGFLYNALNIETNEEVSLKVIRNEVCSSYEEDFIRYRGEQEKLSKLRHDNILNIIDYGDLSESTYVVLEKVNGKTLKDVNIQNTEDMVSLIRKLTDAIKYLHDNGIVHSLLNPSSILLLDNGGVKVIDVGISHLIELKKITEKDDVKSMFAYMSPEGTGALNRGIDERSDLFSIGVILYELITKTLPFNGESVSKILYQQVATVYENPAALNMNTPAVLDDITLKLLEKDPDLRYQSTDGLTYDLDRFMNGEKEFVIGEKDYKLKLSFKTRMIGREEETEKIRTMINHTQNGQGGVCIIKGEAGVGKTRFIEDTRTYVQANEGHFIWGRCVNKSNKTPYYPFKLIIDGYIKLVTKMNDKDRKEEISRIKNVLGELGEVIVKINPEIKTLIGDQAPLFELDSDKENKRFLMVASDFFLNLAPNKIFALCFDDIQWIDQGSLNLLGEMVEKINTSKVLVLGAFRDAEDKIETEEFLSQKRNEVDFNMLTIELKRLTEDKILKIISNTLGESEDKNRDLVKYIYDKSEGNPYFAINILHDLVDEKAIVFENGEWVKKWDVMYNVEVQGTLVDIVLKRIEKITKSEKELLSVASVVGREFDVNLIYSIIKKFSRVEIVKLFDQLINFGLVEENKDNGKLMFVHDRVRDAFLILLDEDNKKLIHKQIAEVLEEFDKEKVIFDLIYHYIEAGDKENILKYIFKVAELAKVSYSNEDAIKYYELGLSLLKEKGLETSKEYIDSKEKLSDIYLTIGKYDEVITICKDIINLKPNNLEKAKTYRKIGTAEFKKGAFKECETTISSGLALLGEKMPLDKNGAIISLVKELTKRGLYSSFPTVFVRKNHKIKEEDLEIINLYIASGWMYILTDIYKYVNAALRVLNIAEARAYKSKEYPKAICFYSGILLALPMFEDAKKEYKKGGILREAVGDIPGVAQVDQFLAFCYSWSGNYEKSEYYSSEAIRRYKEIGDIWELGASIDATAFNNYNVGNYDKALELFTQYYEIGVKLKDVYGTVVAHGDMSKCLIQRGLYDKAYTELMKDLQVAKEHNLNYNISATITDLGLLEYERGNYELAVKYYSEAMEMNEGAGFLKEYTIYIYSVLADAMIEYAKQKSDYKDIREIKRNVLKALKKTKAWPNHYGQALRIAAKYYDIIGKKGIAKKYFNKSIKQTEKVQRRLEQAKGYYEYGLFLEAQNRGLEATGSLLKAYNIFNDLGVKKYVNILSERLKIKYSKQSVSTTVDRLSGEREIETILETSRLLSSILDLNELLEQIMNEAMELSGAERGLLLIKNSDEEDVSIKVKRNIDEEEITSDSFKTTNNIINKIVSDRIPLLLADMSMAFNIIGSNSKTDIKSVICVPIISKKELQGVLYLDNTLVDGLFNEKQLEVINMLSSQAGISIENAKLFKKATTDGLTGIFNRAHLDNYLLRSVEESKTEKKRLSALILDIDHFKIFNDTYGHQVGDLVLKEVAKVAQVSIRKKSDSSKYPARKPDFLARYGGEEFVVVFPNTGLEGAVVAAERIRKNIEEHIVESVKEDGEIQKLSVTVSVGVAELREDEDRIMLIKRADDCLYEAKESGRNKVSW